MNAIILIATSHGLENTGNTAYLIGALIAFLILVYLLYSLIKPEKF